MPTCRPAGTLGGGGGGGGQDGSSEQIWAYIYIMWCGVGVFVGRVPNTVLEPEETTKVWGNGPGYMNMPIHGKTLQKSLELVNQFH